MIDFQTTKTIQRRKNLGSFIRHTDNNRPLNTTACMIIYIKALLIYILLSTNYCDAVTFSSNQLKFIFFIYKVIDREKSGIENFYDSVGINKNTNFRDAKTLRYIKRLIVLYQGDKIEDETLSEYYINLRGVIAAGEFTKVKSIPMEAPKYRVFRDNTLALYKSAVQEKNKSNRYGIKTRKSKKLSNKNKKNS